MSFPGAVVVSDLKIINGGKTDVAPDAAATRVLAPTDAFPTPTSFEPGSTLGNYLIVSKLGEGGMGLVYKAHDTTLDRTVALKVLSPHLFRNQEFLNRFRVDVVALVEPIVEPDQHFTGAACGIRVAFDLHAIAARGNVHSETLLDGNQVAVVIAEQWPDQIRLLEFDLEPGALGDGVQFGFAGHQAATSARTIPVMLRGPAAARVTSTKLPTAAAASTWTD